MPRADPELPALNDLQDLQGPLEHRVRLAVCVLLSRHEAISFTCFKRALGETDGSLGTHLRRLEDEGLLDIEKSYSRPEARDLVPAQRGRAGCPSATPRRADQADRSVVMGLRARNRFRPGSGVSRERLGDITLYAE